MCSQFTGVYIKCNTLCQYAIRQHVRDGFSLKHNSQSYLHTERHCTSILKMVGQRDLDDLICFSNRSCITYTHCQGGHFPHLTETSTKVLPNKAQFEDGVGFVKVEGV